MTYLILRTQCGGHFTHSEKGAREAKKGELCPQTEDAVGEIAPLILFINKEKKINKPWNTIYYFTYPT